MRKDRTIYSVFNEVVETLYSSLAGAIVDLGRYEESKSAPNQDTLKYYNQICKALWSEKYDFYKFSDAEIKSTADKLSPILKAIKGDKPQDQLVIEKNKNYFDYLIKKTAV